MSTLVDWGAYEPAIRQWERALGRPAPHPTEAGKAAKPRLAPLRRMDDGTTRGVGH